MLESQRALMAGVPHVSPVQAERIALDAFGWKAKATALPGERDANFLLSTPGGERFVLKVANVVEGSASISLQQSVLTHLQERLQFVPRVLPLLTGGLSTEVRLSDATPGSPPCFVWAMSHLPGVPLAAIPRQRPALLEDVGRAAGALSVALAGFDHPTLRRPFHWDLTRGVEVVRLHRSLITDADTLAAIDELSGKAEQSILDVASALPVRALHNDLNDHNILIHRSRESLTLHQSVSGIVDFGDMVRGYCVAELAVTLAYAMLGKEDPVAAAADIVRGYHTQSALSEDELHALFALSCLRMCMSLCIGAFQRGENPENEYLAVSDAPMRRAVQQLRRVPFRLAEAVFRDACNLEPSPASARISTWLGANTKSFSPVLPSDPRVQDCTVLDLSVASPMLSGDARLNTEELLSSRILAAMRVHKAPVALGRYDEARLLYTAPFFALTEDPFAERRTIHIGLDLFAAAGTPVHAPLRGTVHAFANNAVPQDYGPVIMLRHETGDGDTFFTLYGHLSSESLRGLAVGTQLEKGERFATLGAPHENVGWTPHLHLQVITDHLDLGTDFPGVGDATRRRVWRSICPDPNLIVGVPADRFPPAARPKDVVLTERRTRIGRNVKVSYDEPVAIARGWMQYLYDDTGRRYLDAFNNVPHVGHSHPRVVRAAASQLAVLNTNTRYLHEVVAEYARRLCETLPESLSVCYLVNSGSEANELALRLSRAYTQRRHAIVLEGAYHGNTTAGIDLSPYKHNGPGGTGTVGWVHVVPQPDLFRGAYRSRDSDAGVKYAAHVSALIEELSSSGRNIGAFLAETCPSVGGQIIPPHDYFAAVYRHVRAAGAVCIADEVQTGFGRMGDNFWAFQAYDVVPDIVVLGKPIGNGYPLGAVITTHQIADSFDNGMEFFSTFGGSTVSCAVGLAVLDVLRDEKLQAKAQRVGMRMGAMLRELRDRHAIIGDVRGSGLFWGVELVRDRDILEPAGREAGIVVELMKERGVLIGTDGPHHNVLKIRPPMQFDESNAAALVGRLDLVLQELQ